MRRQPHPLRRRLHLSKSTVREHDPRRPPPDVLVGGCPNRSRLWWAAFSTCPRVITESSLWTRRLERRFGSTRASTRLLCEGSLTGLEIRVCHRKSFTALPTDGSFP